MALSSYRGVNDSEVLRIITEVMQMLDVGAGAGLWSSPD